MTLQDPIIMPDNLSIPIYLFKKDRKGFTQRLELTFSKKKKEGELDLNPILTRKEWLSFCDKKKILGWSYDPYPSDLGKLRCAN